jgi:alanine racemase
MSAPLTWVEIKQKALLSNLRQFRQRVGKKTKIMAVVKANAYGHGIKEVTPVVAAKADWFGVSSLEEGLLLRQMKIQSPILILGYLSPSVMKEAISHDLSFVILNLSAAKKARQVAKKLSRKARIHLKVETGTNRLGICGKDLIRLAKFCSLQNEIFLEGLYTHYANIEDTLDPSFAQEQLRKFKEAERLLQKRGVKIPFKHTACTAAAILFKETNFNLIRLGLGLYGLWPSRETKISAQEKGMKINLQPVLTWKTRVAQVKEVAKGETIGYGRTFTTARKTKMAVLPVGYWDGYDRGLSNQGQVLIKGYPAPVIGRICMNMMMVDITSIPRIKSEDEVVLLGKQGKEEITAEEIAQKIGTINYEVVTRINPLIPRKVV